MPTRAPGERSPERALSASSVVPTLAFAVLSLTTVIVLALLGLTQIGTIPGPRAGGAAPARPHLSVSPPPSSQTLLSPPARLTSGSAVRATHPAAGAKAAPLLTLTPPSPFVAQRANHSSTREPVESASSPAPLRAAADALPASPALTRTDNHASSATTAKAKAKDRSAAAARAAQAKANTKAKGASPARSAQTPLKAGPLAITAKAAVVQVRAAVTKPATAKAKAQPKDARAKAQARVVRAHAKAKAKAHAKAHPKPGSGQQPKARKHHPVHPVHPAPIRHGKPLR